MNPISRRLASLRRTVRLLEGWRGTCALVTLLLGAAVVAGLLDWYVQLPSLVRALLLTGILGGAGFVFYRYLYAPLAAPCDDLTLALRVEEAFPELNDSLASCVQFLEEDAGKSPAAGSEGMRKQAVRQALAKAEQCDFGQILDRRAALYLGVSAVIVAAVAAHFAYRHPQFASIAFRRLAEPYAGHTWTKVDVPDSPVRVAVGQPYVIRGTIGGVVPGQAKVVVQGQSQTRTDKTVTLKRDDETGAGVLVAPLDMTQHKGKFKFRVLANDGAFPPRGRWHEVEVLPPPQLANLDDLPSPHVELFPPDYAELNPYKLAPGTRHLELLAGTRVEMRAATDRPIKYAWVEYRPENPLVNTAALLSFVGGGGALPMAGSLVGGQTIWGRVPARLSPEGDKFTLEFTPPVTGAYILHLEDDYGLVKEYNSDLRVLDDPLPLVKLLRPSSALTLLPDAEVAFRFQTEDEVFALRSVWVEYRRKRGEDRELGEPERTVLYEGPSHERALPLLLAGLARQPSYVGETKLRPRKLDFETVWHLRNQFKEGEKVLVEVCADDFCNIFGPRRPGRSHQIELQIVSKFELTKAIDEKLALAQQEVVRLLKWQQEARDVVKELQGKDKFTQKELDRLVEAEQTQRQIKERVGERPEDALRGEMNKLQNLIKDNKLKDTEAREQASMIKGALDQLAQQELQNIEPALAQARRQMAGEEKPAPKSEPKTPPKSGDPSKKGEQPKDGDPKKGEQPKDGDPKKGEPQKKDGQDPQQQDAAQKENALDRAGKLQESALKSLDELAKAMSPWATLQQIKGEARSLKAKQEQVRGDLEDVEGRKNTDDLQKPDKAKAKDNENQRRDDMKKASDALNELAKQAENLQGMIQKAGEKRQQEGDKETAAKLKDAGKIAEQAALPNQMRDAANQIKKAAENPRAEATPPHKAMQQQDQNIKALENMLSALEGKKDDVVDRLQKKKEKAQKDLDVLAKKMKELEKKAQQAQNLKDGDERRAAMKKVAEEHAKLQEEIEKNARELARLEEQRAANDLKRAADEVGKAGKKLQAGEDPQENQEEAERRIQQAKQELEESQDELAREQLAKIADKLKGLKERQDAALERTKEFHKKIVAKKAWTKELGDTLEGDALSQQGLAKEARSLQEKIKEAKVFEHILDRAAHAMDQAAEVMNERKLEGLANRQYDPRQGQVMEKEELDDENEKQAEVVRHQTQAAKRMGRLLDALKEELAKKTPPKKDGENPMGEQQAQPKMRPADGIPAVAQLKALKSEQMDVNERTDDFARRHPEAGKLNRDQQRELEQIHNDQERIQQLFQQITSKDKQGDVP